MSDSTRLTRLRTAAALALLLACGSATASATTKGPDVGGYTGTDVTVYSFLDIAGASGGASILAGTDDGMAALTIPFVFQFYGRGYSVVCVSSNGAVYFVDAASACSGFVDFANTDLTAVGGPNDLPAALPFWSDLTFQVPGGGAVFYQTLGAAGDRKFVIQWNNAFPQGSPNPITFQAILTESSHTIRFQYKTVQLGAGNAANDGGLATVGIRNAGAPANHQAVAWSFAAPVLADDTALLFGPHVNAPPLFVAPTPSGPISVRAGSPLIFTVRASDPDPGDVVNVAVVAATLPAGATSSTNGPANPVDRTVNWTPEGGAVGPHTIVFSASDNAGAAAGPLSITVNVTAAPATPTIVWANPAAISEGTPLSAAQLNATVNAPGTLTYTPPAGALLSAGVQTLTVAFTPSDAGAFNPASKMVTITVLPVANRLSRFVALGVNQLRLRAKSKVVTGDVGANISLPGERRRRDRDDDDGDDDTIEVRLGEQAAMLQPGSRVVGDTVSLEAGASVYDVLDNELVNRHATIRGTVRGVSLPFVPLPALPAITPGTQDVTVDARGTMTLPPGRYRSIRVRQRATLILTGGLYQAQTLDVDDQATILIRGGSELRIKGELDTGSRSRIIVDRSVAGMKASSVVVYVGDDDTFCRHDGRGSEGDDAGPAAVHIGEENTVDANIYAPNGTIWLKARTVATGAFIARRVRVGEGTQLTLDSAFK